MRTPMDDTLDFLKQMEEEFAQIQKEHWDWFYDESGNALSPRVHYNQLDESILCLASVLAHKAEQIQKERARDAEREARAAAEALAAEDEDPDYGLCDGGYEEDEPNPYHGTYSEE